MDLPKLISVDDHVVEPPHVWDRWLPAKYRDRGPKIERRGIGNIDYVGTASYKEHFDDSSPTKVDCWVYEDLIYTHKRMVAAAGYPKEEMTLTPITYEQMRPGCYDPKARLDDMDVSWVEASMCFPTLPRFCGQTFYEGKDKDLGMACVVAYNDWMVEEWCGDSGGRLIPLGIIPLWDVQAAAAEVRRNAARGVRAVCFSELPYHLGLPTIHSGYWDPFFDACAETGTVVAMHIGSSSKMPAASPDAPPSVSATLAFGNAMTSLIDFLMSGLLVRYPALKLMYAESQIGWIPYALQRVDQVWEDNQGWAQTKHIPEPPSTYYYRSVYGCFINDPHGLDSIDEVGEDNITAETDYPHSDSTWPDSGTIMAKLTAGLTPEQTRKVLRGNAIRLLDLPLEP
ncbi:amidohydrolase [Acidiferrimicrobium sp. IK]|uniref:amidohydrolase family protein n=1 Tax=Acidiferrimicrobium sp. IK TaxID=2871700 RepID=UPI0021CB6736|nr:amidohydrolase family protein [Acidiferrimicrobium sp. IK]MCU4183466.1 amidohydrolase [Acidiferrimicrobium sp. IK]